LFPTSVTEYYSAKVWFDKSVTTRTPQIFEIFMSPLKILDARNVTISQNDIKYPHIGATIKNDIVKATGRAEFAHV
jgi:hypothetical protein